MALAMDLRRTGAAQRGHWLRRRLHAAQCGLPTERPPCDLVQQVINETGAALALDDYMGAIVALDGGTQ